MINNSQKLITTFFALVAMSLFVINIKANVSAFYYGHDNVAQAVNKDDCSADQLDSSNCKVLNYLVIFINVLSAIAGITIIGSIIFAGIQYSMSGSDPQKVSAAKSRIRNAIIALVFFLFGYTILNYLVPGGVL